jgi:hypothetical protein
MKSTMEEQKPLFPDEQGPEQEELGLPLTIVSFCIPIVGAVIYFQNKDLNKGKANTACYAALGGMALGIVLRVITMALG